MLKLIAHKDAATAAEGTWLTAIVHRNCEPLVERAKKQTLASQVNTHATTSLVLSTAPPRLSHVS